MLTELKANELNNRLLEIYQEAKADGIDSILFLSKNASKEQSICSLQANIDYDTILSFVKSCISSNEDSAYLWLLLIPSIQQLALESAIEGYGKVHYETGHIAIVEPIEKPGEASIIWFEGTEMMGIGVGWVTESGELFIPKNYTSETQHDNPYIELSELERRNGISVLDMGGQLRPNPDLDWVNIDSGEPIEGYLYGKKEVGDSGGE